MNHSAHYSANPASNKRVHQGHSMTFHGGYKEAVLFDFWTVETPAELVTTCTLVALFACLNELMKFSRMKLSASYYERRKPGCDVSHANEGRLRQSFIMAALGSFQTAISLLIMLITMTYNIWLFLSAIIGIFVGQFYVSFRQPLIHYTEEACH